MIAYTYTPRYTTITPPPELVEIFCLPQHKKKNVCSIVCVPLLFCMFSLHLFLQRPHLNLKLTVSTVRIRAVCDSTKSAAYGYLCWACLSRKVGRWTDHTSILIHAPFLFTISDVSIKFRRIHLLGP